MPEPKRTAEAGRGGRETGDEIEGIEDRWKRRAELSAESPGRKTRHHRKIALSRIHLFSIPSSWPFASTPGATLLPTLPRVVRTPRLTFLLCMHQPILPSNSVCTNPFRQFPLFRFGHRTQFSSGSIRMLARFSVERAIPRSTKLPHFFSQTKEVNFEW